MTARCFPPKGVRDRSALYNAQRRANEIISEIENFLLAQRFARRAKLQDGNAGGVELEHVGRMHSGGIAHQNHLGAGGGCATAISILTFGVEVGLDDGVPVVALRLDVLDVVDVAGHGALKLR